MRPIVNPEVSLEALHAQARLRHFWDAEQDQVENVLADLLACPAGASERLYAAMRHAVLAPAKRLRPILCIATYKSLGGDAGSVYHVAAAIEMLHTYSLIHDDLPCMDDDEMRRGRPTVHVAFDEATAVLAGDALQALAFQLLSRENSSVANTIARAVGPEGMAGGQMADLEAEGMPPTEDLVTRIHELKTGRLIAASVVAGAMLSGKTDNKREYKPLCQYGHALGLAFQIVDDILELTMPTENLGKPTDSDLKLGKVTYPAAVGLEQSKQHAAKLVADAKESLVGYIGDPTLLLAIADFIISRDR